MVIIAAACHPASHHDADASPSPTWTAAGGGWTGVPCDDGLHFSADGTAVYACTTTAGVLAGSASGGTVAWHAANTGIDNLAGSAIATHPISGAQLAYVAQPASSSGTWFRSSDTATTWTSMPTVDGGGQPYAPFAV